MIAGLLRSDFPQNPKLIQGWAVNLLGSAGLCQYLGLGLILCIQPRLLFTSGMVLSHPSTHFRLLTLLRSFK
jgi:hypothetical protein